MVDTQKITTLLTKIAEVGRQHPSPPLLAELFPFRHYFDRNGILQRDKLSENDGLWTRREILTRFLFLQAVLDQGTHIEGIRRFLTDVTNSLYEKEIRFLHKPLDFFRELGIAVDDLIEKHETVKKIYAPIWADENQSNANKFNLMRIDKNDSKQVLNYAIHRWGVPLAVPYLLEKDLQKAGKASPEPLAEHLERFISAEVMSQQMKDDERYGLGKAIGDKAAHLFVKWYIHTFGLAKRKDAAWSKNSYELPLDSNVGRVLLRTGFWLQLATMEDYQKADIIQLEGGKKGTHYLRVTNIRGTKPTLVVPDCEFGKQYLAVMKTSFGQRKRTIELQRIPNALLINTDYFIGDLDDGIIHIGTKYCLNHENPKCNECPLNRICLGHNERQDLIDDYRT
ncbi:hypothetical protein FACS189419_00880 [Planctomycetales bacterium]|nr:hypothetical protein FACS189419_00880 [Planctomycetales bacterium]